MKMPKFNAVQKIILCVGFLLMALRCFLWNAELWYSGTAIYANSLSEYMTRFPAVFVVATVFHCLGALIVTALLIYLTGVFSTGSRRLKIIIAITIVLGLGSIAWWVFKKPAPDLSPGTRVADKTNDIKIVNTLLGELDGLREALDTDKTILKTNALSETNQAEILDVLMKEFTNLAKILEGDELIPQTDTLSETNYFELLNDLMKELNNLTKELELDK